MSEKVMEGEELESESCEKYIFSYISKTLKLKFDKWSKMMANDEYKEMVNNFVEKGECLLIMFTFTNNGHLIPYNSFTFQVTNKVVYIIKPYPMILNENSDFNCLIVGDLSTKFVQHLSALIHHIVMPIVSNRRNSSTIFAQDKEQVKKALDELYDVVEQVRGLYEASTFLLLPNDIIEFCDQLESSNTDNARDNICMHVKLKRSLENTISKWNVQIKDIISQHSAVLFNKHVHPSINDEMMFWTKKLKNLKEISHQLKAERMNTVLELLKISNSCCYSILRELFISVEKAIVDTNNITIHLKPLVIQIENMEKIEYKNMRCFIGGLMHTVCLVWANSTTIHHRYSFIINNIMKLILNKLIQLSSDYLKPCSLFETDVFEILMRISTIKDVFVLFRELFIWSDGNLGTYFKEVEPEYVHWNISISKLFECTNLFLGRIQVIETFFSTVVQYNELEKIEFGGINGQKLTLKLIVILQEFRKYLNQFHGTNYNAIDLTDDSFLYDYSHFMNFIFHSDRQIATLFCLAFDDCNTCHCFYKFFMMVGNLVSRKIIASEFQTRYKIFFRQFECEVHVVKEIYDSHIELKTSSLSVESISLLMQLQERIIPWNEIYTLLESYIPLEYIADSLNVLQKYDQVFFLIENAKNEIFENWTDSIPKVINDSMNKSLFVTGDNGEIVLNFDQQLKSILKEIKYIKLLECNSCKHVACEADKLYLRYEELQISSRKLDATIHQYNEILHAARLEEIDLIRNQIAPIDQLLDTPITWNAELSHFTKSISNATNELCTRLKKTQNNLKLIVHLVNQWNDKALFVKCENSALLLTLQAQEKASIVNKRYKEIYDAGEHIYKLLDENFRLFCNMPSQSVNIMAELDEKMTKQTNVLANLIYEKKKMIPSFKSKILNIGRKSLENKKHAITKLRQLSIMRSRIIYYESHNLEGIENVEENLKEKWNKYLRLVDGFICQGITKAVSCSVEYIYDGMTNGKSPIFEIKLQLQENNDIITFVPALSGDHGSTLPALISQLIQDIQNMNNIIPSLALVVDHDNEDLQDDGGNNNNNDNMKYKQFILIIHEKVNSAMKKANELVRDFEHYSYLWKDSMHQHLNNFLMYGRQNDNEYESQQQDSFIQTYESYSTKDYTPTLDDFKCQIDCYNELYEEIDKIIDYKVIDGWLKVDLTPFKKSLLQIVGNWSMLFKKYLMDQVNNRLKELKDFIQEAERGLLQSLEGEGGECSNLVQVMSYLVNIRNRSADTDFMFEPIGEIIDLLASYDIEFAEETYRLFQELPEHWINTKRLCMSVKSAAAPFIQAEVNIIKKRIALYEIRQCIYKDYHHRKPFVKWDCNDPFIEIDKTHYEISEMEKSFELLCEQVELFEIAPVDMKTITLLRKHLKLAKSLWDYILMVKSCIQQWQCTAWKNINSEAMDIELRKFSKEIRTLDKDAKEWTIYEKLEHSINDITTSLKVIRQLQNPAIRPRHWQQMMHATKVSLTIDDNTLLKDLLALNLHKYEEEVKNIVDQSVKEMFIEKSLKEFGNVWAQMEWSYESHVGIDVPLIKRDEYFMEKLEDNQLQLQNMISSKFVTHFMTQVNEWQQTLANVDQLMTAWMQVQRTWLYLQSIFLRNEDISKQFPHDSLRFANIDKQFTFLLKEISETRNIIETTRKPMLYQQLETLQHELGKCEKALSEFLESKRLVYPRFYFISPTELLDILAKSSHPAMISKHLGKLYDSIANLKFNEEEGCNSIALGMYAKDGEYVQFVNTCECNGPVEKWLNDLTSCMKNTGRYYLKEAVVTYEEKARENWLFDYPAQTVLCANQIWWASEVAMAFAQTEQGYETALKEYNKKQIGQLNTLISLLLKDLSHGDRQKVTTVCTIDVHCRDVVSRLIAQGVESFSDFQWQSQLRHRWDTKWEDCYANICDAQFRYNYEYLGNSSRLVITPLTDRCYITLTQSLHLTMGAAAAGPAGTGKTETTKDLGKALGMMVYVFNCSEQMDYKSCGNIYKGLAQTGAWGCFDEFNRISVDVLSVVAVQVKCVLDAIKAKKSIFNFLGEKISLIPTVGMFITMNPGYAGRTELPENLKALFRPCAMITPDLELICEIMLVTQGFQQARTLARKFITLHTLCKQLLSKQDHYDWGLRAIKSLLVVAGSLKRCEPNRPEEQVLMRALRDFNLSKIVTDDIAIFLSLINDLFPTLNIQRKQNGEFEKQARAAAVDLKLQPEDNFILRVVQLKELFQVRHSVFIVGCAGCGKTEIWKTLYQTYVRGKLKPYCNIIEPKAVTNNELFGIINPITRDWKDGLFSALMREQCEMSGTGPRWIIMDGDIDPMWIESLNTLMDDNKVLTLASNERISLTENMRLLFETSNLSFATPATVSRAGILYINSQDIGWSPYVTSWMETRTNESEKAMLMMLIDKYVPTVIEARKTKFKGIIEITEISYVQMLCCLLECLLIPSNVPRDCPKEWFEIYFVFACIWAFGSALVPDQSCDWPNEFSKWWINEFKNSSIKFPANGNIFDYYVDDKTKRLLPWSDKMHKFNVDPDMPLSCSLVHTNDTTRVQYFLKLLLAKEKPVILVGPCASGKTALMTNTLSKINDGQNHSVSTVPFNFYTTSEILQKELEKHLEKKAGRNYGPKNSKCLIYFIDDMTVPQIDVYATIEPHTLIRQYLNYGHWYDRTKLTLKAIHNITFVACLNPTIRSSTINPRLLRHFYVFALSCPNSENQHRIYRSLLDNHFKGSGMKFSNAVLKASDVLVQMSIATHVKVTQNFLPSAIKFYYNFNLRDVTNLFQGMLLCTSESVSNVNELVKQWTHEACRAYSDKLSDRKDKEAFAKLLIDNVKKYFPEVADVEFTNNPLIYSHFTDGIGNGKYKAFCSWTQIHESLMQALQSYNDLSSAMNLVFFEDAMCHICRINRILECAKGNAMLIGVGGSGKQSLAKLAAFISSLEVFEIQTRQGYTVTNMKTELCNLYMKTGLKNVGMAVIMSDSQLNDDLFLVPINDILASGQCSDLFTEEDVTNIFKTIAPEVKASGVADTFDNCWKFFIDRVSRQLRIILCFSPVNPSFRERIRKFPSLMNCCWINWFLEWPQTALESVSFQFLNDSHLLPQEQRRPVSVFMAHVHTTSTLKSTSYFNNDKRYNYATPKTFLEFLNLFKKLLNQKSLENTESMQRFQNGVERLEKCAVQVDELKINLAVQEAQLAEKKDKTDELIKIIEKETLKTKKEKCAAADEERKVRVIEEDVAVKQKMCEEDLRNAEPMLTAAKRALNTLNKNNLTELKSFGSPPAIVVNVTAAVMVLLSKKGKIPKDRSWKACKIMMAKLDAFLDSLINYSIENIYPDIVKIIQSYLNNGEFNPELVRTKSSAAAGLCEWVINIMKYYDIWTIVEPKRKALAQATLEYTAANSKLKSLNDKIQTLENELKELNDKLEEANVDKMSCIKQREETAQQIDLANRLVSGLSSENIRWREGITSLQKALLTLSGDILLVCAYISYVGCFSKHYRMQLYFQHWLPILRKLKPEIAISCEMDPLSVLVDQAQIAVWNNEGLPNDRMSTENAMIFSYTERWPLLIDPQLQGLKWIKIKYGDKLTILKSGTNEKDLLKQLEQCIVNGRILLLEGIQQTIDPIFYNLISKNLINKNTAIKLADNEIDYNENFRLILQTKLANPHYKPEIQAQTCLINFTVTKDGLEEQLLANLMKLETPQLELYKCRLTKDQNDYKIKLKQLEDELLLQLSSAGCNLLVDSKLVENLECSKKTAIEIVDKVSESRMSTIKIDEAREQYRNVAITASVLYFIMNDLQKIQPIYQYSLKSFYSLFEKAVRTTTRCDDVSTRVERLISNILYSTFLYVDRGLFQKDKLTFLMLLTIQMLSHKKEINADQLDFLLRFPSFTSIQSPVDFIPHHLWAAIKNLSLMDGFRGLDKDIESCEKRWKKYVEGEKPEEDKLPQEWKNKRGLEKLCIMRTLRPDRMIHAMRGFIKENLGSKFVEDRCADFATTYKEMGPTTPMLFILSAGVDPTKDVETLAFTLGFTADKKNFHNISLGQGQEKLAEEALEIGAKKGHWVMLQNIHLVKKWLPILDKKMQLSLETAHTSYRLFLSAEPGVSREVHVIPQGIVECCIKITNEPPTGMLSNLHKALENFDQETLEMSSKEVEFKTILFSLCYFHACISERRKFGAQGWNKVYPFNVGDLTICVQVLYNYLESNLKIPWDDLRYLFGEIMYGGHITDDWDRTLCTTYLQKFLSPQLLEGEWKLAEGFPVPSNRDYNGYHQYIDEVLPSESPILYGLHPNAQIALLTKQAQDIFRTILEIQPADSSTFISYAISREDKVRQILDEIMDKLPQQFNLVEMNGRIEERTPYTVVALQECQKMNILIRNIKQTLTNLNHSLKGEISMTADMDKLEESLFLDKVPDDWKTLSYPSLLPLSPWFSDLLLRYKELESWVADFSLPSTVWLGGLFDPRSFLTAILQSTAHKNEWPLDKMVLQCDVMKKHKDDFTSSPRDGSYVYGLYMEGASWDSETGSIEDAKMKELYTTMPVIHVRGVLQEKQDHGNVYMCPVYRTRERSTTYVATFNLKTLDKPSKWVICGTALLLSI